MAFIPPIVEKVARAMCAADGRFPDQLGLALEYPDADVSGGDVVVGKDGKPLALVPTWRQYVNLAHRFVAAHRALAE